MNLSNEIKQMNIHHAIKGEVQTELKGILQLLNKERLNNLASNYGIAGRSKMKKQEIVDALYPCIVDANEVRAALVITRPKEWGLVNELLKEHYINGDNLYPGIYLFLMDRGLIYSFYDKNELIFVIPEEIKVAYNSLQLNSFFEDRERCHLVLQYIDASTNLYGICPVDKLFEIFNAQNERQLTETEFAQIHRMVSSRVQSWYLNRDNLINDYFSSDTDEEEELLIVQVKDKPYYIPDKKEFLNYSDSDYFENTPQLNNLKTYILRSLCKDEELVEYLIDDIQLACSMEEPLGEIMYEFERRDIRFNKREQVKTITSLIVDVINHTRIWSNRGHTPAELGSIHGNNLNENRQQASSIKIGRNDPCPCGSGKKYKKCCNL